MAGAEIELASVPGEAGDVAERMVRDFAERYRHAAAPAGFQAEDLEREGKRAFEEALRTYASAEGKVSFETYAGVIVRNALRRMIGEVSSDPPKRSRRSVDPCSPEAARAAAELRPFFTRELPLSFRGLYAEAVRHFAAMSPPSGAPCLSGLVCFVRHAFTNYGAAVELWNRNGSKPPEGWPPLWRDVREVWDRDILNTLRTVYGRARLSRFVDELRRRHGG